MNVHYDDIGVTARYMELHDLVLSKLGAGRPKDMEFCSALAGTNYIDRHILEDRLPIVECTPSQRALFKQRIETMFL